MSLHRLAEERSLALHRAIAARIRDDPRVLERARTRVARWLETGESEEICAWLVDESEHA